jgi:lipopolysaccharide/colanic/teichoic acid biosynthesis glycosyltransferase
VILAFLVSRDGHSPFYRQERLGMGGRIFSMWKLRSMVPDADARLAAYLAGDEAARREWDAYQKLTEDPRITPLGKLLRKTSLDELPQLWNVLKGDMSLVGPRPMMPQQRALYPGYAYFTMRPGVTGLWQVSDRNASTFAQRAEFDADYERKLSLATDMSVLLATVAVVLRGTGQ